jgi:hypothetical protein
MKITVRKPSTTSFGAFRTKPKTTGITISDAVNVNSVSSGVSGGVMTVLNEK